jgi:hypothetical protein
VYWPGCGGYDEIIGFIARDREIGRVFDRRLREKAGAKPAQVSVLSNELGFVAQLRLPAIAAPRYVSLIPEFVFV